jgi:protein involved in polysaccharide export with SLBB domain
MGAALLLIALVGISLAQSGGGGQSSAPPVGGPLTGVEGPIISERYVLMPGDQVLATITGGLTFSYSAWITYEGKVVIEIPVDFSAPWTLQIVDAVPISGLNLKDAQDSLARVFSRYLREVQVKLTLTTMRSGVVFVTGEVHAPGAVYASPIERVSQVVAKAGGLTPLGSRNKIQLLRGGQLHAIVNIERFENNGDLSLNPFVESGDRIYVPPVSGIVTVKGAVFGRGEYRLRTSALTTEKERVSEGMYELDSCERVTDLLKKAGGITPWADLRSCYVLRRASPANGTEKIAVDLSQVLFQNDQSANIMLRNDDVLVVPPVNTMVYVEGEVLRPGA